MAAAALGSVPVTVAGLGLLLGGMYAITSHYGVVGALSADQRGDLLELVVRVVVIAAAATVCGAVLGTVLRNTAAAVGVTVGYGILVEGIFSNLIQRFVPDPARWLVQPNFQGWVGHGLRYYTDSCASGVPSTGGMGCERVPNLLSFGHASMYFTVLVVVCLVVGGWLFSRRDVS